MKLLYPLILSLAILLSGCGRLSDGDSERTLILAHAMHETHPVSVAMAWMPERLREVSDGALDMKIYPAGQLGSERNLLELTQIGTVGISKLSSATLENVIPEMRVFSLPYLFEDPEQRWDVWLGPVGQELLKTGIPFRVRGIAYYDAGSRSIYTVNRPVFSPEDLNGLRIRVTESVMAMRLMRAMGASPAPLAFSELYTAFQGGVMDGAENNPPSFHTTRHYEVCNYYTLNRHTVIPDMLVISNPLWESLSEQERDWLQQVVGESVELQRELWQEAEAIAMQSFRDAGVKIIEPDLEPFRQSVQPFYDSIRTNDPELYAWVERIRAEAKGGNP
ncbi:MAG: TRAP transporter substrate-binding protein [Opitutales bacterium]|nr:TRAP transporter substrate-binding protein [Opitutales bacterium]